MSDHASLPKDNLLDEARQFIDERQAGHSLVRQLADAVERLTAERNSLRASLVKPKPRDPNDPVSLAERALTWMQSAEGQESMRKAAAESNEFAEKLRAASNIPWERLHEPFTI